MSGAQSLLCEMLSCGSMDLEILDRIGYGWTRWIGPVMVSTSTMC